VKHPELEPPQMRRRLVQPLRQLGVLFLLTALPVACLLGTLEEQARRSTLQVIATYFVLLLAFRLLGKRELSRLSPFELVTLMLVPEILSNAVQGQATLLQGLAGLCSLFALVLATSLLSQNVPKVQDLLESAPAVLVVNGRLQEQTMNRERIAPSELLSEMHKQGLVELTQVRFAILEGSGNITFVPTKAQAQPHPSDDAES
jgi:uncharacterized membrane protein YcaP (DUF421 family)